MDEKKTCPACGESVRLQARFCCFCENEFPPDFPRGEPTSNIGFSPSFDASVRKIGILLMAVGILTILWAVARWLLPIAS